MHSEGEKKERVVCDYISGMTDQYAVAKYREFFFAKSMGDRLGKERGRRNTWHIIQMS